MNYKQISLAVICAALTLNSPAIASDQQNFNLLEQSIESEFTPLPEELKVPEAVQKKHYFDLEGLTKYQEIVKECVDFSASEKGKYCLIVDKSTKTMDVYVKGKLTKTYRVELGTNPFGDKEVEGDRKTPEGIFKIPQVSNNSSYHKSLLIGYPNQEDGERGLEQKIINQNQYQQIVEASKNGSVPSQKTKLGSYIMIHGAGSEVGQEPVNWTGGCVALSNDNIDDLYQTLGLQNHKRMSSKQKSEILKSLKVGIVRYGGRTN